jgi:hypothetical protein
MAALSKAQKAFMPSGAFASIVFSLARFFRSYMDTPGFEGSTIASAFVVRLESIFEQQRMADEIHRSQWVISLFA